MPLGWGIIGIGLHADRCMAPAIAKAEGGKLVAVCSRDPGRAAAFAAKHGAQRSYRDYGAMLRDDGVEAVYVATPNNLHAAQTIEAARAGKHVLCDKPMALTVPDAERMIEACARKGVKLGMAFQNRHHPAHVEARRLIALGAVGEVSVARAEYSRPLSGPSRSNWRGDPAVAGAGSLMGMGLHPLDLLRYLTGREVELVQALTDEQLPDHLDNRVLVLLRLQGGCHATVTACHNYLFPRNDVVVYGTRATIAGVGTVGMQLAGHLEVTGPEGISRKEFPGHDPVIGSYRLMVEAFSRSVTEGEEPNASGRDGLEMVRLAQAVLESSRQGKAIVLRS
ncbi:MAG: Gfo/Idh/MocA family oxidoreductase [Chloroflexi bacterium]|nr:Gfo/Idh/MocA family oxidoreductase [Chloroflexota bacterium]